MREAYFIHREVDKVKKCRIEKGQLAREILGTQPLREIHPDLVGDRSRLDLMFYDQKLGIRGLAKEDFSFDFFPIQSPESCTPLISEMIDEFMASQPILGMSQIRFRSNRHGLKGLWIDASHKEQEKVIKEREWIKRLLKFGWIIEMGQKGKRILLDSDHQIKFTDKVDPEAWLSSFNQSLENIDLTFKVSDFSQPGEKANKELFSASKELLDDAKILSSNTSWQEWGSGYGNLTGFLSSALSSEGESFEISKNTYRSLEKNSQKFFPQVKLCQMPVEKMNNWEELAEIDLWVSDPPRSGFAALFHPLKENRGPKNILCFHCHHKGLIQDSTLLNEAQYSLKNWISVDIFPATPHHEVLSLWTR